MPGYQYTVKNALTSRAPIAVNDRRSYGTAEPARQHGYNQRRPPPTTDDAQHGNDPRPIIAIGRPNAPIPTRPRSGHPGTFGSNQHRSAPRPLMSVDVQVSDAYQARPRNARADLRQQHQTRPRARPRSS